MMMDGDFDAMIREGAFNPPAIMSFVRDELNNPAALYGLPERAVAIESLLFLHGILVQLKVKKERSGRRSDNGKCDA